MHPTFFFVVNSIKNSCIYVWHVITKIVNYNVIGKEQIFTVVVWDNSWEDKYSYNSLFLVAEAHVM